MPTNRYKFKHVHKKDETVSIDTRSPNNYGNDLPALCKLKRNTLNLPLNASTLVIL